MSLPIPIDLLRRLRDGDVDRSEVPQEHRDLRLTVDDSIVREGWRVPVLRLSPLGKSCLDLLEENERLRADLGRVVHELRGLAVFNFPSGPPAPPITEPVVAEALAQVGAEMDRLAKEVERLRDAAKDGQLAAAERVTPIVGDIAAQRDAALRELIKRSRDTLRGAATAPSPAAADEAP